MVAILNAYLGNSLVGTEEEKEIIKVIADQNLFRYSGSDTYSQKVESIICQLLHTPYAVLVNNGTAALKSALLALQLHPGEEVVIPGLTFIATANAVLSANLIPRLIDVEDNGHLSSDLLNSFLEQNPKVRAVIAVHLDGSAASIETISNLCNQHQVALIEDVAQSFSVTRKNKALGTYGIFGCYSFQQNKIMSSGEGGALITNQYEAFKYAKSYGDFGAVRDETGFPRWEEDAINGENFKISELASAVLYAQLNKLNYLRKTLSDHYKQIWSIIKNVEGVHPRHDEDVPCSIWINNKKFSEELQKLDISYSKWLRWDLQENPIIKNRNTLFAENYPWNLKNEKWHDSCPNARDISLERISLPIFLQVSKIEHLSKCLERIFA